ncbi:lipoate--protein ligase [Mangrovibacterium diazotrophicum]|uniref:lipoate--protein ligase n=1 Tax=Mangrovibacterium diazotrophicum TaxID=1261403 RepID=A0A419W3V3_9BACT|nr:lipoate--protein ligase [Mangrovibacterium diazotrophicum]RKD90000.1 lipoate-protein ligase A [Mangrovibacterium diazotrophicum]
MLIIDSPSNNAYFNIASEEYLLKQYPNEEIFLLYVNAPSIIVGRFQNTLAEINLDYVTQNQIKVVRRMSGGGAVYHDLGNLNFSFHTPLAGDDDFSDFSKFTQPVVDLLNGLDVPARLEGRNDLLVDGKKFSGNAKLARNGKMIQHGTILLDSEMSVLSEALKINPLKFRDKAVKSARARVTNLIDYFPGGMTVEEFKQLLINQILQENETNTIIHQLNPVEVAKIEALAAEKYSTWDWNFGGSPAYNFNKAIKVPAGFIELHLDVKKGVIQQTKIFGDFFASRAIEELEEKLNGQLHETEHIRQVLSSVKLTDYFGNVTVDEILELFK